MESVSPGEIKQIIRKYLQESGSNSESYIEDQTLLFQENHLDSLGLYALITFIESKFHVVTTDVDFVEENFESIVSIQRFILSKINEK